MNSHTPTLTALALVSVLLTACGGGGGGGGSGSFSSTSSNEVALVADPDPSTEPGVLTVTDATVPSLNGVYGNGQLTLSEVYYQEAMGGKPATCAYKFAGADKVDPSAVATGSTTGTATVGTTTTPVAIIGASTTQAAVVGNITTPVSLTGAAPAAEAQGVPTAFGKISYRPSATGLYVVFLTFNGKEYASLDAVDTLVDRSGNLVRFTGKTMGATDGSTDTLKLTAIIPLHATRNPNC